MDLDKKIFEQKSPAPKLNIYVPEWLKRTFQILGTIIIAYTGSAIAVGLIVSLFFYVGNAWAMWNFIQKGTVSILTGGSW